MNMARMVHHPFAKWPYYLCLKTSNLPESSFWQFDLSTKRLLSYFKWGGSYLTCVASTCRLFRTSNTRGPGCWSFQQCRTCDAFGSTRVRRWEKWPFRRYSTWGFFSSCDVCNFVHPTWNFVGRQITIFSSRRLDNLITNLGCTSPSRLVTAESQN